MRRVGLVLGVAGLISGCANISNSSTNNNENTFIKTDSIIQLEATSMAHASAVRWNKDYIVTVKHFEKYKNKCASDNFDLAFIKSPMTENERLNVWSEMKTYDKVTMMGFIRQGRFIKTLEGEVKPGVFNYMDTDAYKLVSNKVIKGMSGGPVKNELDEVVGIVIGYTQPVLLANSPTSSEKQIYSVTLPFQIIKDEFIKIEEKFNKNECV